MNRHLDSFANLTTEYLLERRALGDELAEEAHEAIETILTQRGERIPPRPVRPILVPSGVASGGRTSGTKTAILFVIALVAIGAAKALAATWIGLLIAGCIAVYATVDWFRRSRLSPEARQAEDLERTAERDGLTELMRCAADCDLARMKELINYGADVNATSAVGTAALMYAARNNHLDAVAYLLSVGARRDICSDKGQTAAAIAERFGHAEVAKLLAVAPTR